MAAAAVILGGGAGTRAATLPTALHCTNPTTGSEWDIPLDAAKSTVDSYPAEFSDEKIYWRDLSTGRRYTFDRNSGVLVIAIASSTGGYFNQDNCKLR